MLDLCSNLHAWIDTFEGQVLAYFGSIKTLDLRDIRKEMDVLRAEVHSFTKSYMTSIPPVVPLFVHPVPLSRPGYFDLFMKND